MKSDENKQGVGGDKVSRKKTKEQLKKSQEDLMSKIDSLDAQDAFSKRILDQSNSVISYYKPLFNDQKKIVDFVIAYVNQNRNGSEKEMIALIGEKMSTYYPPNFDNGVFEELVCCHETNETRVFQKKYKGKDGEHWFSSRAVKLDDGVLIFSKDITKEKELEIELDVKNKLLSEAEYVANIGSYKWNLDEDVITYSDNAFRLLGYEPDEFEPSAAKFMSFIHPDDSSALITSFESIMQLKERTESTYRIVTKDKTIKTIRSVGEFYRKDGQWYMVGVILDISKQVATEQRLRNRNRELKRTNEELESFNRIASHDLQEPLRKIQMFVSRLDEDSGVSSGGRNKGYLEKIVSSVDRMRDLISNLLSYSRINEVEERPVKVDLNVVLTEVEEEMSERIADLNAKIKSEPLPKILGIEFQLIQLFTNLIGNSLKYSKQNVTPVINITSQIVPFSKIDKGLKLPRSSYVILHFEDNGIGFGAQYKEKIFEIFQRLHSKNEYSGTGLGLAICRKIVNAHNGIIGASSTSGKGSIFTVYLPYSA